MQGGADASVKNDKGATAFGIARAHPQIAALLDPARAAESGAKAADATLALSQAQLHALAGGAILAQMNSDTFDTLPNRFGQAEARNVLLRFWSVTDHDSTEETIRWLDNEGHSKDFDDTHKLLSTLDDGAYEKLKTDLLQTGSPLDQLSAAKMEVVRRHGAQAGTRGLTAWDQGRLVYVVRLAHTAGYLSSSESWSHITRAAASLQEAYTSWQEIGEHYLIGRLFWNPNLKDPKADKAMRWLLDDPSSPWRRLPWKSPS